MGETIVTSSGNKSLIVPLFEQGILESWTNRNEVNTSKVNAVVSFILDIKIKIKSLQFV